MAGQLRGAVAALRAERLRLPVVAATPPLHPTKNLSSDFPVASNPERGGVGEPSSKLTQITSHARVVRGRRRHWHVSPLHTNSPDLGPIPTVKQVRFARLSQEGSVIAFFAMTRGVVPQTKCLGMHS